MDAHPGSELNAYQQPPVFVAVLQDISERRRYIAELEHKSLYDTLTDLPNRNLFIDRLQHALAVARRATRPLAVVTLDIARLREVNDILGHHHGDVILQEIAKRHRSALRETDTVARLGGDEFAILLPGVDAKSVTLIVMKVQKALEQPILIDHNPIDVEVNAGVALYPEHGEDPSMLLSHADMATQMAKNEVSRLYIYQSSLDTYGRRRLELFGELRRAIAHGDLVLHYQPQVNLATGRVSGVEALARWPRAQGDVSPVEFIPVAEQTGLIRPFTLWVLEEAVRQCCHWRKEGLSFNISINLSARNLLDPTLADAFADMLGAHHVAANCFVLEVTESAMMAHPDRALQTLTRLHEIGVNFSIDDFGTGYSSLAYLKRLPVNELKIDRSFVSDMVQNENDAIIVRSTIDLAHNLGLKVVAEGVENQDILQVLAALGCDTGQGYHFTPPLSAEELSRWLSESPWANPRG